MCANRNANAGRPRLSRTLGVADGARPDSRLQLCKIYTQRVYCPDSQLRDSARHARDSCLTLG
eukprot:1447491-Prymnesium_polylepis.1